MNQEKKDFRFDVFISYRHSDLDSAAAGYLHKALENYKIPKEIQQKIGKKRINRVFRDEEELGASSDLFTEIENSIKESEYLLVVLSPRYKQSKWCIKEIESFLKYRSRDNILAVIIEGEPYDVFPDILLEEGEPLALDIRAKDKKQMLKYAKDRLPRLVAPILGCSYDELYQRHRVWRMRRIAMLSGLVATLSLAVGAVTIKQNIEINKNYVAKQENQSRYLAKTSNDLLSQGDRETALLVALEALPKSSGDTSRPYVAEARIALEDALYTYQLDYYYNLHPIKIMEMNSDCGTISDYNQQEDVLLTSDDLGTVYIWDAKTGRQIFVMDKFYTEDAHLIGENRLLGKTSDGIYCVNYMDGNMLWTWEFPVCANCYSTRFVWDYNPETQMVVCANTTMELDRNYYFDTEELISKVKIELTDSHRIQLVNCADGNSTIWTPEEYYSQFDEDNYNTYTVKNIAFSPDGSLVALQIYQPDYQNHGQPSKMHLYVYPAAGGKVLFNTEFEAYEDNEKLHWIDNSKLISAYTNDADIMSIGLLANPHKWFVDCYDVTRGEILYTIQDSSLNLNSSFEIDTFDCIDSSKENFNVVSLINGNVALIFDQITGTVYSRIEDRSQIRLVQPLPNKITMLVITHDGYVFVTKPMRDEVYSPMASSMMYYLDVGAAENSGELVEKCVRYNDKTYFFNGSSVYWYQDYIDMNFKMLDSAPVNVGFSDSSQYMYYTSYNNLITLYDVTSKEVITTDDCTSDSNRLFNTAIVNNRFLVYPAMDIPVVSVFDIESGLTSDYNVENPFHDTGDIYLGVTNHNSNIITAWNSSKFYGPAGGSLLYKPDKNDKNIVWVKDITNGADNVSISYQQVSEALDFGQNLSTFTISSAYLSGDGKYVIIPVNNTYKDESGADISGIKLIVWDIANNCWLSLNEDINTGLVDASSTVYIQDGWILPDSSIINTYHTDGTVNILDLSTNEILHSFNAGVVGSREIAFTPDGDHLIFQDGSNRLKIYNWKEGVYTLEKAVGEMGALEFQFYQDGKQMSATMVVGSFISRVMQIYDLTDTGIYTLQNSIAGCVACDGITTVISENDYSRFYPYYTFDQLIDMAHNILGQRTLTPAERQTYFID